MQRNTQQMKKKGVEITWKADEAHYLNREYAATVSENNPLSNRYLRMFPESLVFGYSGEALTIDQGSAQEIVDHMKAVGNILQPQEEDGLSSFFTWLNSSNSKSIPDLCNDWEKRKVFNNYHQKKNEVFQADPDQSGAGDMGCALSEAIRNKNDIEKSLNSILNGCLNKSPCKLLHQNMNRIFAINNDYPDILKNLEPKQKKILLENLSTISLDKNSGFVNRANALYLYKQLGSYENLKEREREFFKYINTFYDSLEKDSSTEAKVYKEMLAEVIWKNNLGQTLSQLDDKGKLVIDDDSTLVNNLIEKFNGEKNDEDLQNQALLIEAAVFQKPFTDEGKKLMNNLKDRAKAPKDKELLINHIGLQMQNKNHDDFLSGLGWEKKDESALWTIKDTGIDGKSYYSILLRIMQAGIKKMYKRVSSS